MREYLGRVEPGVLPTPELSAALDAAEDLEREYVRLFVSPTGAVCPPWQSSGGAEPRLMGEPHHSALKWFWSEGFQPSAANEPADHIGLLLLFAAHLLAHDAAQDRFRAFADDHLAWVPSFCDTLAAEARHPFYRLLARLTQEKVRALASLRS
ncbi:MAG TPA: molecular chaperone TorD family protein [Bryobacteraceae bacterium]|nr:molecular chaperone TorD family protein [Bryobacteraceae bacterium]